MTLPPLISRSYKITPRFLCNESTVGSASRGAELARREVPIVMSASRLVIIADRFEVMEVVCCCLICAWNYTANRSTFKFQERDAAGGERNGHFRRATSSHQAFVWWRKLRRLLQFADLLHGGILGTAHRLIGCKHGAMIIVDRRDGEPVAMAEVLDDQA